MLGSCSSANSQDSVRGIPEGLLVIVSRWPEEFRRLYGGSWPDSYACVDIETSGFDPNADLILEFGLCLVQNRELVTRTNVVINWDGHPAVVPWWLRERIDQRNRRMALDGKPQLLDYDTLVREGVKADKVLVWMWEMLDNLRQNGWMLVGHNAYSFDERMLAANFDRFLEGIPAFRFGENGLIDTGCIEKASQAADDPELVPWPGDSLESYFRRVANRRLPGVRWNLDTHCFEKYGFDSRPGVSRADCHSAGADAYLCHLLMEEYRKAVDAPPAVPAAAAPPAPAYTAATRRRGQRRS